MSEIIQNEIWFFLISVATGMVLLMGFELLRALRNVFPGRGEVLSFFDFLYWVLAGIGAFYVIFQKNSGILRGFSIAGMLLGMFFYHISLSKVVLKLLTGIIRGISTAITWIIRMLILPICLFSKKFRKIILKGLKNKRKEIKMYITRK